jgi:hypothetical protein
MAFAWIERIKNTSSKSITLLQTDPTYHPVVNGRQYNNKEIVVPPGTDWTDVRWFAVPWQAYGKLTIAGPNGTADCVVGPIAGETEDYLKLGSRGIKLGPPGDFHAVGGVAFELAITPFEVQWNTLRIDGGLVGFFESVPKEVWEALGQLVIGAIGNP